MKEENTIKEKNITSEFSIKYDEDDDLYFAVREKEPFLSTW